MSCQALKVERDLLCHVLEDTDIIMLRYLGMNQFFIVGGTNLLYLFEALFILSLHPTGEHAYMHKDIA